MIYHPAPALNFSGLAPLRGLQLSRQSAKVKRRCFGLKRQRASLQRLRCQGVSFSDLKLQQACEGLANSQHLRLHVLLVPLVGLEGPAEAAAALWRAVGSPTKREPLALHSIVVMSSSTFTLATDFLPVEPLAPTTALQLLQGKTPGRVRLRQLSRLPSRQIWSVAEVSAQQVQTPINQHSCGQSVWSLHCSPSQQDQGPAVSCPGCRDTASGGLWLGHGSGSWTPRLPYLHKCPRTTADR